MLPNRVIYPPYRRIAFNVYLKQNDGLLANHLVESENISYNTANSLIEEFTFECIQNLEEGKKVNISDVGTLYFDHEKNIQFEAFRNINHKKESFGMEPVHIAPIARDLIEEVVVPVPNKKIIQKPVKAIRKSEPAKRKSISRKGVRILGLTAAIATIAWFSTTYYINSPKLYEATSLNPFDSQALTQPLTETTA